MMKKGILVAILFAVGLSFLMFNASAPWAQGKGPIKIGFITPLSGGFAANGKDMLMGFQLYLEEIGYQVAGRKIELLIEDDEAIPATSLTKTRKLVEKDGVHMMAGGWWLPRGMRSCLTLNPKESPCSIRSWPMMI